MLTTPNRTNKNIEVIIFDNLPYSNSIKMFERKGTLNSPSSLDLINKSQMTLLITFILQNLIIIWILQDIRQFLRNFISEFIIFIVHSHLAWTTLLSFLLRLDTSFRFDLSWTNNLYKDITCPLWSLYCIITQTKT